MSYAKGTEVSIDKSQSEIKKILAKYNATGFAYGEKPEAAVVMFEMAGKRIRFNLPMPDRNDNQFNLKNKQSWRKDLPKAQGDARHEQAKKERWRALTLTIKAKLESVAIGITTLEEEFLAHIVLPNGMTMGEVAIPQIQQSYQDNKMPPLLGFSG